MTTATSIEDKLNELYRVSWSLIDDLGFIDIPNDDPIKTKMGEFVKNVRKSYDVVTTKSYGEASELFDEISAAMIGLCKYKDKHLPQVDPNLSTECAKAYRALFGETEVKSLDATLINETFVEKMENAYKEKIRTSC